MPELEPILRHVIWNSLTNKCKPLPSLPIKYNQDKGFRSNVPLSDILRELNHSNIIYKPTIQV